MLLILSARIKHRNSQKYSVWATCQHFYEIYVCFSICRSAVLDLGGLGMHAPTLGPNSFVFMQFSANKLSNNRLAHPLWGWRPRLWNPGPATAMCLLWKNCSRGQITRMIDLNCIILNTPDKCAQMTWLEWYREPKYVRKLPTLNTSFLFNGGLR